MAKHDGNYNRRSRKHRPLGFMLLGFLESRLELKMNYDKWLEDQTAKYLAETEEIEEDEDNQWEDHDDYLIEKLIEYRKEEKHE